MIRRLMDMLYFDGCYAWLEIDMGSCSLFIGVYEGRWMTFRRWNAHNTTKGAR